MNIMCKATISLLADNKGGCYSGGDLAAARRYLRKVFKDVSARSSSPHLGLDQQTFLKCTGLPGLLGEQFFRALDTDSDGMLSTAEFVDGFVCLYRGSPAEKTGIVFDVLDFGRKGYITPKGVKIMNRYLPTFCEKCGAKLARTWSFPTELRLIFPDKEVLSYDEIAPVVSHYPSFFDALLQALLMSLPPVFATSFSLPCFSSVCTTPPKRGNKLIPVKVAGRRYFTEVQDQALYLYAGVDRSTVKKIVILRGLFVEPTETTKLSLKSADFRYEIEAMTESDRDYMVEAVVESTHFRWFDDYYETGEIIGEGAFGQVVKGWHKVTRTPAAVKIINKQPMGRADEGRVRREIDILRLAKQENLLELYDVFETNERVYIVTELVQGGTLFDWLQSVGFKVAEDTAKDIIRDVAAGLHFLHKLGVVHRDVKLENILLVHDGKKTRAKLIDYGLATFLGPGDWSQEPVGTLKYVSPEVISRLRYREKVDNWSLGVILYIMLRGTVPFYGKSEEETALRILKRKLNLHSDGWSEVSTGAKDVLERLLSRRPDFRMSLKELLSTLWVAEGSYSVSYPEGERL